MTHSSLIEADNWTSPAFFADPYLTFRSLREQDSIHWNPLFGFWIVTSYDEVMAVLQDTRFGNTFTPFDTTIALLEGEDKLAYTLVRSYLSMFMQGMDPPLHTRQRALIHKSFTPRMVERLRERTYEIVQDLLTAIQEKGELDLMRDLASPLPSTIIFELLGIPLELRDAVRASSETIAKFVSLVSPTPGQFQQMGATLKNVGEYLKPLIAERRTHPRTDLLSLMVQTEEKGEHLSEQELIIITTMLLFAGHETTTNLIGNGVLALLKHPDQLKLLQSQPELLPQAVEEMLRYNSPVMMVPRFLTQDVEMKGKHLHKGELVMIGLGASNHDPQHFTHPDRFEIQRKQERILSFGFGIHFCIGAALARMEAQIAIGELIKQLPRLQLATEIPSWRPNITLRGLQSLPISF